MDVEYQLWQWVFFFVVVLIALFVDIGIVNRKPHVPSRKETFFWSSVWVSMALLFGVFVYWQFGAFKAKEFYSGYLIELSLSVDNLFVFLLVFNFFKVPKKYIHRVLFWGILLALIMRMVMIFAGATLVEHFEWLLFVFGAFLLYSGISMFGEDESFDPEKSRIVKIITRFIPITKTYEGEKFFVTIDGKRTGTLLFLVFIIINVADLVFAIDSIPAIFGITTDRFIVYTSNIFAILGLRTFYFLLSDMADRFHYLKYGLAFVLSYIGFKMLLPLFAEAVIMIGGENNHSPIIVFLENFVRGDYNQQFINISLVVIAGALLLSVVISLVVPPKEKSNQHSTFDRADNDE